MKKINTNFNKLRPRLSTLSTCKLCQVSVGILCELFPLPKKNILQHFSEQNFSVPLSTLTMRLN